MQTGELLRRLNVQTVNGLDDPGVGLFSDEGWAVGLAYAQDHIRSVFEDYLAILFVPYLWHDHQLSSSDMRSYKLRIDGALVHQGAHVQDFTQSQVSFGEGTQGNVRFADPTYGTGELPRWVREGILAPAC